ncbi:MAG: hypothetical protein MZV70_68545 [Desulfobacterales bacterium]|nr:hypothetical protein [Desulfobacterales bacterium]
MQVAASGGSSTRVRHGRLHGADRHLPGGGLLGPRGADQPVFAGGDQLLPRDLRAERRRHGHARHRAVPVSDLRLPRPVHDQQPQARRAGLEESEEKYRTHSGEHRGGLLRGRSGRQLHLRERLHLPDPGRSKGRTAPAMNMRQFLADGKRPHADRHLRSSAAAPAGP